MFKYTSSKVSPWVEISADKKSEARLTAMLYLVRSFGSTSFKPLTGEEVREKHSISLGGVKFTKLTLQQLAVLKDMKEASPIEIG